MTASGIPSTVDSTIQSMHWTYNDDGVTEKVSSKNGSSVVVNEIKYTYDAGHNMTKMELDHDSVVGDNTAIDTRSIDFAYGTDFTSSGNHKRLDNVTYPNGRKIWYGYTHSDTANTLQDTINDKFNRTGQIANDNSGAIGDIIAQYDFNGLGRMVRRSHDDAVGWDGNDTRVDLWHGTAGTYSGLDRFGRIVDMKHVDYSGTAVDLDRYKYAYDEAGNRCP